MYLECSLQIDSGQEKVEFSHDSRDHRSRRVERLSSLSLQDSIGGWKAALHGRSAPRRRRQISSRSLESVFVTADHQRADAGSSIGKGLAQRIASNHQLREVSLPGTLDDWRRGFPPPVQGFFLPSPRPNRLSLRELQTAGGEGLQLSGVVAHQDDRHARGGGFLEGRLDGLLGGLIQG